MNRKHNKEYYLSIIEKLKKVRKNIKISSDFIVGYPGETDEDFNDTIELVKKVCFINSYSFIFSSRPGTVASTKELNNSTKNEKRLRKLQKVLEDCQNEDNKRYLHKYCEVLIENKLDDQEKYFGRTKHMMPVIFNSQNCENGALIDVKITSFNQKIYLVLIKLIKWKRHNLGENK